MARAFVTAAVPRLRATSLVVLAVLVGVALVACGGGDEEDASGEGALKISNPRARFTTTDRGAVYFDITNTGDADVLLTASAAIADDAQVHEIVTEGASARMQEVGAGIPIEAGGSVRLQPGGYHVMLLGVDEIPAVGATFTVVLEFERAGRMTVTVPVEAFGAEDEAEGDHEHDHDDDEEADHDHE